MKNFRLLPMPLLGVLRPPAMADHLNIAARATAPDLIQRLGQIRGAVTIKRSMEDAR
jgi:hypothetical protein